MTNRVFTFLSLKNPQSIIRLMCECVVLSVFEGAQARNADSMEPSMDVQFTPEHKLSCGRRSRAADFIAKMTELERINGFMPALLKKLSAIYWLRSRSALDRRWFGELKAPTCAGKETIFPIAV